MMDNFVALVFSIFVGVIVFSCLGNNYKMHHTERNRSITVTEKERVNATTFLVKGTDLDGNQRTFQLASDLANAIYEENLKIETGQKYQFVVTGKECHIPLFTQYEKIVAIN